MKTINHIKNWKKSIFWIIPMLLLGIIACREELNQEYFETSELSVKTSEITKLLPNMYNSKFTFSWTAGNNQGTNSAITYKLELDKKKIIFQILKLLKLAKIFILMIFL